MAPKAKSANFQHVLRDLDDVAWMQKFATILICFCTRSVSKTITIYEISCK